MSNWLRRIVGRKQDSIKQGSIGLNSDDGDLRLLLVRPSLDEIFGSSVPSGIPLVPSRGMPSGAVMFTSFGFRSVSTATEDMFSPVGVLCVNRLGHVGYVATLRLDIRLVVGSLAEQLRVPLGEFFAGRDVLLFTKGWFRPMLSYADAGLALGRLDEAVDRGLRSQTLPKICYATTWTSEEDRVNLQRMTTTAEHLLNTPRLAKILEPCVPTEMPRLGDNWIADVVNPLFLHVESRIKVRSEQ